MTIRSICGVALSLVVLNSFSQQPSKAAPVKTTKTKAVKETPAASGLNAVQMAAAQEAAPSYKSKTLFTVGGEPVTVGEFEYVYTKNNINNQADFSKKSLTDYLKLYENFRLKVKEAEVMKIDTITSLMTELEGYRKQLAKSYLTDKEISDKLLQEAYERSQKELNVSHILIRCDENANPADTAAAYKKALALRARLVKGENFGKLAAEASEDPSAKDNNGEIGWFSAFQTVYPFETAAYNATVGEVSQPVRTQFGYHLLKVNQARSAQGEMKTAHLLLKFSEKATEADKTAQGKKIDSIYNDIKSGKITFEDAVAKYSEDRLTRNKKGELPAFGTGRMVPEFEEVAFGLKADGDIAKPVRTTYGYHIIKRLERKPLPSFNDVKADLKRKVERDSRSQMAKSILIEKIKRENNYQENVPVRLAFFSTVDSTLVKGNWIAPNKEQLSGVLFTLGNKQYTKADFASYVEKVAKRRADKNKDQLLNEYYDGYVNQVSLDYEEGQLESKKPEFKALMKEYRDGILLFELTDRKVWSNAVKDTAGLETFYSNNKTKYMWGQRLEVEIFNTGDKKLADAAYKLAAKGKATNDILAKVNKEGAKSKVSIVDGKYEKGQYNVVDEIEWKAGVTPVKQLEDSSYRFIVVKKLVEPEPKTLKEAKGYIVSDYQEYLEKTWLEALRNKYPIVVDEQVFNSLIKK